ncbi:MAG TPA: patatin-like phospholipase family protein [Streptosporangiaceae bacterium]
MAGNTKAATARPDTTGKRQAEISSTAKKADRVAVVAAGAGARGAYEAGALSIILPVLEETGQRPSMFVGTSAGAINAALFASLAHLPARQAAARALDLWGNMKQSEVFPPAVPSMLAAVPQYIARLFGVGRGMTSLLSTKPLLKLLTDKVDWDQLHQNVETGKVEALAIVTTATSTDRTSIFVEHSQSVPVLPVSDDSRAIDYYEHVVDANVVRASAAIPAVFPPVLLGDQSNGDWYVDGGVRLNAPLKPAISLGAQRLVVVATDPLDYLPVLPGPQPAGPAPNIQDEAAQIGHGLMADRMVEDIRTLMKVNVLANGNVSPSSRQYKQIPYIFAGPTAGQVGQLGQVAAAVLDDECSVLNTAMHFDLWLFTRLIGPVKSRGDIMSYLLFEPAFAQAAIQLGQQDAQRYLDSMGWSPASANGHVDIWRTTP